MDKWTKESRQATISAAIDAGVKALTRDPFGMRAAFARDVASTVVIATLDTVVDSAPGLRTAHAPGESESAQAERWARERVKRARFIIDWEDMEDDYREAELAAMLPLVREARGRSRDVERLTQQVEILAARSAAAEARLLTTATRPAPLTEEEVDDVARFAWGAKEIRTPSPEAWRAVPESERVGWRAVARTIDIRIRHLSRHDIPAEVRADEPKREPMSGDFDFASCQHPEHARNEADDGTTWCILCGDVLSAGRCGKIAPDGYPGAGNPCTLPAGHASGHEARSADGRLLAVSLPPTPGDIPDAIRPEAEPAVQAALRGLERVAPVDEPHCPRCGRTKSVSRWTNEQTGEPFYVCSTPPPGNGCGHSFAHPTAEAPAVPERLTCEGAPCPSRYHGIACEKRGRHDTHGTLDGLNMWLSHVADLDARGGGQ